MARMLPREVELVSQLPGVPGGEVHMKCYERSKGLDTALYKNIPLLIVRDTVMCFM